MIDLKNKMNEVLGKHCAPIEVAKVNDQVVRMVFVDGEYHWHKHTNQEELFYVLQGELVIKLKEHPDISLSEGQMAVIPKGVIHCPKSIKPTFILLFEPFVLHSSGD